MIAQWEEIIVWHRLPREIVAAPSLEVSMARAWRNLGLLEDVPADGRRLACHVINFSSNPNHSKDLIAVTACIVQSQQIGSSKKVVYLSMGRLSQPIIQKRAQVRAQLHSFFRVEGQHCLQLRNCLWNKP